MAEEARANGDPTGFLSGGFFYSDFAVILAGCVDFDPAVPESERRRIVQQVAHDKRLARPISESVLLRACSTLERDYLSRPLASFRLLTETSIWWIIDIPRTRIDGVTLTFKPKLDRPFAARALLAHQSRSILVHDLPANYMRVSAQVSARSPSEAADRGLEALDLLRASWNLALNRGKTWRETGGGRLSPVNDIRLSPFHTVHDLTGKLATSAFWYDPGYAKPATLFNDKDKFANLVTFGANLRRRLISTPYQDELRGALIRYVRALDSADLNDAFLRLWSLLEFLTDSTHDPYKVATRRAAFMFDNKARSQLVLSNLTNYRNRFVHVGSQSEDIESLVFQLKRYVDALLLFHLGNRLGFKSRAEAASFMDLPADASELRRRQGRLQQALRFIGSGA
jgi:hypothetical protein